MDDVILVRRVIKAKVSGRMPRARPEFGRIEAGITEMRHQSGGSERVQLIGG